MNIDLNLMKKYWWVIPLVGWLGLSSYFDGLRPVFTFQLQAHAEEAEREMVQTNKKLDQIACLQIVANYITAKKDDDATMMAHWAGQAKIFNCTLPA